MVAPGWGIIPGAEQAPGVPHESQEGTHGLQGSQLLIITGSGSGAPRHSQRQFRQPVVPTVIATIAVSTNSLFIIRNSLFEVAGGIVLLKRYDCEEYINGGR